MGCSCSKGDDTAAIAAKAELNDLCKQLQTRLAAEAEAEPSPHSTGVDATPHPEIRQVVLGNPKITSLTIKYLNNSTFATLTILAALKQCIKKGQRYQAMLFSALRCFDVENNASNKNKKNKKKKTKKKKYSETVAKLKALMNAGDLFDEINTEKLQEVHDQQQSLLKSFVEMKSEIKKKLRSSKKWRKVYNAAFMIVFVAVLTGSIALAALGAPFATTTAANVTTTAMKAVEPWFIASWDKRDGELESEKEIIKTMRQGSSVAAHELESIKFLVQKLKNDVESINNIIVEFALGREEDAAAIELGVAEIRRKTVAQQSMDELQKKVELLEDKVRKSGGDFLKIISQEV